MKKILWLLLLLPGIAAGQIYIDSYKFAAPAAGNDLFLDSFPSASAAISLRQLDKDYTGNIVTIRRTSNGDTTNIGFVNNYLDTATLKTFCGSASTDTCYVRRWFDQSGNNNNLNQTTNAEQPRILTAGVLEKDGATVSVKFDGVNDNMEFTANTPSIANNRVTVLLVIGGINYSDDNGRFFSLYDGTNTFQYLRDNGLSRLHTKATNFQPSLDATEYNTQNAPTVKFLSFVISRTATANDLYVNNVAQNATAVINRVGAAGTKSTVMVRSDEIATTRLNGEMSEIIIYAADKNSDRDQMSANLNTFYSIY